MYKERQKIKYMYSKNLDLHVITRENYNFYRLNKIK